MKTEKDKFELEHVTFNDPLVGAYFHTFGKDDEGKRVVERQGYIAGKVQDGVYVAQYFEWIAGHESTRHLVKLEDMHDWNFYRTCDQMNFYYEYRLPKRRKGAAFNEFPADEGGAA